MIDFLRFYPPESGFFEELFDGYSLAICFCESDFRPESRPGQEESIITGSLVRAETPGELHKKLRKARGFVGVMSSSVKVNREAIMRRKVDALLDFEDRAIDYPSLKLAAEKDVVIEVSLSKLLRTRGFRRMKLLDETRLLLRLLLKFETPFVLTTGASNVMELRPRKQLYRFFSFLARDAGIGEEVLRVADETGKRIYRRLLNEKYLMDGLEIEEEIE